MELYAKGRNVYIFAVNRQSLTNMRNALVQGLNGIPIETPEIDDMGIYEMMGGITQDEKELATRKGRIILITFAFGSDQISILQMDAIILADSRMSQMTQVIGRIFRRGGDKSIERIIIDVVDEETGIKKHHSKRVQVFKASKYNIRILPAEKISYKDILI
jgi:predicted helicase